jgi:hypothetical protein
MFTPGFAFSEPSGIHIGLSDHWRVLVVVGDYELFNFIEEYLVERCDLPSEYRTMIERPGGEIITMYFPVSVTLADVEASLMTLSQQTIEDVYRLNN